MQTQIKNGKIFCNGAEAYVGENRPWNLVYNFDGKRWKHELARIELSGYKVVVDSRATDVYGDELPDTFAILAPEELQKDPEQVQARQRFFESDVKLRKEYKQKLVQHEVVDENFFSWKRPCYYGCEEEYGLTLPDDF